MSDGDMFTRHDPDLRKVLRQYKSGKIDESTAMVSFRFIVDTHCREEVQSTRDQAFRLAAEQILNASIKLYRQGGDWNVGSEFKQFLVTKSTKKENEDD